METLTSIQSQVEAADTDEALLASAGEAFERIRAVADEHAIPGALSFAAWSFVTVASSAGRNAVGYPPTAIPAELGGQNRPIRLDKEDDDEAARSVANLAEVLHRSLTQRAETATLAEDRQAFSRAADAASDILDLIS